MRDKGRQREESRLTKMTRPYEPSEIEKSEKRNEIDSSMRLSHRENGRKK